MYWSIVTMITVGYGDIVPTLNSTRLYSIFIMMMTSGFFGFIMNKIAFIFQEIEQYK